MIFTSIMIFAYFSYKLRGDSKICYLKWNFMFKDM
ncbi:hypothetical protein CITSP_03187 [Citrobacter sp. T1.2D-1]|nr:hypothetical protein CITSP_03187 [Citrobacter sp. T1.2D-1]